MRRSEKLLLCVGLSVTAAGLLFQTLRVPELYPTPAPPQTDPVTQTTIVYSRYAVNINEATAEELMGVRGVSEELAQNIVRDRDKNGRFFSTDDLLRVTGIGEKLLEQLRPYITTE